MLAENIAQRYLQITQSIAHACANIQRMPSEVSLLTVSKTHPAESVQRAYEAGARNFGENYVQEGIEKIEKFDTLIPNNQAIWHFIGPLQSNKTRPVAEYFDWVHSIDRLKIAQRLNEQRPLSRAPLNVCIQVNIDQQSSKSGCEPDESIALAKQIIALPHLRLRGLMAIPAPLDTNTSELQQRPPFIALHVLFNRIKQQLPAEYAASFDTLSMGMTDDYPQAIAAGSTMVRIGTAIFGSRQYPQQ